MKILGAGAGHTLCGIDAVCSLQGKTIEAVFLIDCGRQCAGFAVYGSQPDWKQKYYFNHDSGNAGYFRRRAD